MKMKSLKKVISLREASKMSGYNQDYLGSLIRKGEIKATKIGRSYFTTEEEIKNYIFAQKVIRKEWAFGHFFSQGRIKKILIASFMILVASFVYYLRSSEGNYQPTETPSTTLDADAETLTVQTER
ncbi:MAG TPA: hypothetical protein VFQ59_00060 [Candidatus Paceibacterota bacterium]|nr:hypothetical protein [Candidatus Paceibacterota bacterium]